MTPVEEFCLQEYQDLGPFEGRENMRLKRHPADGRICLEKRTARGTKEIYETLKHRAVFGVPEIFLCTEDGHELIVIEKYIEGKPLSMLLERGHMDLREIVPIADCLCETLRGLHHGEVPVICRDLKAENIILDEEGMPWLVDFDIARFYQDGKKRDTTLLGTAEYAAPEQFGFFQTDQRTDLYSLGVLMNLMATGRFPVEEVAGGALGDIVRKCTHLEPAQRYQDVDELQRDLNRLKKDLGMEYDREPDGRRTSFLPPGFRRRRKTVMVFAALVYGILAWLCFTLPLSMEEVPLTGLNLRFQQGAIFLSQIVFIFLLFRYRGWGKRIPLLGSRNLILRGAGLATSWFVLVCAAAVLCVFADMMFF